MDGILYFTANDGKHGVELWRSNGTPESTYLVKDIQTGSSKPSFLRVMAHNVYFTASDAIHGFELWRSNGTAAGTTMVVDITPAYKVSSNPQQMVNAGGTLYLFANDQICIPFWHQLASESTT